MWKVTFTQTVEGHEPEEVWSEVKQTREEAIDEAARELTKPVEFDRLDRDGVVEFGVRGHKDHGPWVGWVGKITLEEVTG